MIIQDISFEDEIRQTCLNHLKYTDTVKYGLFSLNMKKDSNHKGVICCNLHSYYMHTGKHPNN